MKKIFICGLGLMLALSVTGCAKQENGYVSPISPPPTQEAQPIPSIDELLDANGKVVLDKDGHINQDAFIAHHDNLSTSELLKLVPYCDGALTDMMHDTLAKRLISNFEDVIAQVAGADLPKDKVSIEMLAFGIGNELKLDLEGNEITREDCQILYNEYELSTEERVVLDKIKEGYEK